MLVFEAASADSIWRQLAGRLREEGKIQDGRDQPTRELLHVGFTISDPRQRLVFARPMNPAFAVAEVIWMLAGFNDVEWLSWSNPRVRRLAADNESAAFHGAYGERLGAVPVVRDDLARRLRHPLRRQSQHIDQLRMAYEALKRDPTNRQVVLQYWDAGRDLPNPTPRSRDIPCNLVSHLLIRDKRLHWLQVMRSNDLIWGLPYNLVQFTMLQEIVAGWLGLDVGSYQHVTSSLHIYQRHWASFDLLDLGDIPHAFNASDLRISSYEDWQRVWSRMVDCADDLMEITSVDALETVPNRYDDLPSAYRECVALLTAEAILKAGEIQAAERVIQDAGAYWSASWRRWATDPTR